MNDVIVCGIDHHRKWMLQVVSCDCSTGARKDFVWFFNTRAEAETQLEQFIGKMKDRNTIVKIVKVRAFEHLGSGFEQVAKEN